MVGAQAGDTSSSSSSSLKDQAGCRVSTQRRFLHPRIVRGISLHKGKQISSSRAVPGEQTPAGKQNRSLATGSRQRGPPKITSGAPPHLLNVS